jgi:hypothetical protein
MPGIKVFVSVGRTSTPEQEAFVSAIESHMLTHGLVPQSLGRNYWSSQQPLRAIDELMRQCSGVAIVGFERLHILQGLDRRGSEQERPISGLSLPTVWNQIEAAMAYVRSLPLLVLVQEQLRAEGLLETGYDWYVKRMPMRPGATADREFCGIFDDWRTRVEAYHASSQPASAPEPVENTGTLPTSVASVEPAPSTRRQLRTVLERAFNDDELRALCFDLGVDYENLSGATKVARAIAIVGYFERMHRVDELRRAVKELRPGEL